MIAVALAGRWAYRSAHDLQRRLVLARAAGAIDDIVLLLEHAEVITVGRQRGARGNVVAAGNVPVVDVERGGDVTWHGPGQLVAYPIIQLAGPRRDLHRHLRNLEQSVIGVLADLGLTGVRDERNTGVWLPMEPSARKVCSIGIACKRWVTWHGLALNVDVEAGAFQRINPCGMSAADMTMLSAHLDPVPSMEALGVGLARHLAATLELPWDGRVRGVDEAGLSEFVDPTVLAHCPRPPPTAPPCPSAQPPPRR